MLLKIFTDGQIYVVFYIYLFITTLLESSKQYFYLKDVSAWLSMMLMTLLIGLRWETGTDWIPYKELFDEIELNWSFLLNVYHFDIGYVTFNALVRLFSDKYTIFLLINAFITIYFLYRFIIKTSPYPNLSLFLFYTAFMIAQFMGSNRRMMAMVFILWAFYYLYKHRKFAFTLMILIAFLFHRSSIICLIVLLVPRDIIPIRKTIILLSGAFLVGIIQLPAKLIEIAGNILIQFMNNPLIEKMVFYSENGEEHIANSTGSIVVSTILAVIKRSLFLLFYFYIIRHNKIDKFTQWCYNIYIFGFIGYLIFVGSFFQMLTTYFAFIEIVLLTRMYSYTSGKTKSVLLLIMLLYGFAQMINALFVYPDLYIPYISTFSTI